MTRDAQPVAAVTPASLERLVAREREVEADLMRARDEADRLLERARQEAEEILAEARRAGADRARARSEELQARRCARTEATIRSLEEDVERLASWPAGRAQALARLLLQEAFGDWDAPGASPRGPR